MNWELESFVPLAQKVIREGEKRPSRAGDVYSLFGESFTVDVSESFPVLHGRKMFIKPIIGEFAAMLKGPKNVADFKAMGCNYWDSWGAKQGDCLYDGEEAKGGELNLDYGNAWLDFNGVNQLEELVNTLQTNTLDRRMIVTGWRPDRLKELSLPCCHMLYQFYVREGKYLDMVWYQRSVDTMVGLPSDVVLAATWVIVLAKQVKLQPGKVKMMLGDTHIYANHIPGTVEYFRAVSKLNKPETLRVGYYLDSSASLFNFHPDMLDLHNYNPSPAIKFELNV